MRKPGLFWFLFLIFVLTASSPARALPERAARLQVSSTGWQALASGIEYGRFTLPGPVQVFVTRMDRSNPDVTLETAIANDSLLAGRETVRSMALRSQQTINYWDNRWGGRNKVVVAINGFFFNLNTGTPWSGQAQSGWLAQRFWEFQSVSGFGWTLDRDAFIGECIYYPPSKQIVTVDGGEPLNFDDINYQRGMDELIIYTPQYAEDTGTDNEGVEVLVQMSRPLLILPASHPARGVVVNIRDGKGSTRIPFDHVVLSATGIKRTKLLQQVQIGSEIAISQQINDCLATPTGIDWTKTYAGIGADHYFLKGGVIQESDNSNHNWPDARTAVAYNDAYIFFIVVDGHNPGVSVGITMNDLAAFARDVLSATFGATLDSGGSSTMVVNDQVVNNTYCNFNRCDTSPFSASQGAPGQVVESHDPNRPQDQAIWSAEGTLLEALVANSLMMVSVERPILAAPQAPGTPFAFYRDAAVRSGPGNNYPAVTEVLPAGTAAEVIQHPSGMNGILATGEFWWYVDFDDYPEGWVPGNPVLAMPHRSFLAAISHAGPTLATALPTTDPFQDLLDLVPLVPLPAP